jgi:hypothetical protein
MNRYSLGVFEPVPLTPAQWKFWTEHGYVGTPKPGYVPKAVAPPGRTDFPMKFTLGWRKLKKNPAALSLGDEEALQVLEKLSEPESAFVQQQVYRDTVAAATLALLTSAKRPLSRLDILHRLKSDYPVSEVTKALTRLSREGTISAQRNWKHRASGSALYQLAR